MEFTEDKIIWRICSGDHGNLFQNKNWEDMKLVSTLESLLFNVNLLLRKSFCPYSEWNNNPSIQNKFIVEYTKEKSIPRIFEE